MAIATMQKVEIFSHKSEKDSVLSDLQMLGVLDIQNFDEIYHKTKYAVFSSEDSPEIETVEKQLNSVRFAAKYLTPFLPKQSLFEKMSGQRLKMTIQEYKEITEAFNYESIVDQCQSIDQQDNELTSQLERLRREKEELMPWRDLDIPLDQIGETRKTTLRTLFIPRGQFDDFINHIQDKTRCFFAQNLSQTESHDALLLIYLKEEQETITNVLGQVEYKEVTWESYNRTPKKLILAVDKQIEKLINQKKQLQNRAAQLVSYHSRLLVIEEYLSNTLERIKVESRFAETNNAVMIRGWTRAEDYPVLKKKMEKVYSTVHVQKIRTSKGEKPPVFLENQSFSEPFEMVTDLYGSPSYFELDPTPALAPFFVLFLAMCLTDAGYGLIVALLSFLALKKLPLGQGPKRLFSILFYTGLVTLPVGAVTGGYFGLDFSNFSPALQSIRNRLMLFNPLEGNGSIIFLGVCMAVGFVHVCFGLLLAFYDAVRKGKIVDGIYDQVSWLGLLIGLVLLGLGRPNLLGSTVATFGKWMALFSAGVIVLFGGRSSKNPIARIFTGLYSLYGITGYFGDILSYSRLMAMGMATGVIAMVINTMIGMIQDIPIVGVVLAAFFFVVGHLFNILINMVSGFIHTMRLQFVEFFQKFLEGGGNPFKPLKQQYRYALIVDKEITQG